MEKHTPNIVVPALVGGGVLGFLAGLPVLDLLNCCTCCSFGIGAGFLAAFMYSKECRRSGTAFQAGLGAGVGAMAGVFWGFTAWMISTLATLAFGEVALDMLRPIIEANPQVPPEVLDQLELASEQGLTVIAVILDLIITLVLGAVFATLGGLIGGAAFKYEPPAAPSEPVTPPAPTV